MLVYTCMAFYVLCIGMSKYIDIHLNRIIIFTEDPVSSLEETLYVPTKFFALCSQERRPEAV